jgi:hypothetical protein
MLEKCLLQVGFLFVKFDRLKQFELAKFAQVFKK